MNLIRSFYILFLGGGLTLQSLDASTVEHELPVLSDNDEDKCLDTPCHPDATCTAIGADEYGCKCNGDLIGDGVTACEFPRVPIDVSSIMELKRKLKKKKKIDQPTCFPGDAMVTVEGKGQIEMRHVQIGDRVLGMHGKYTPVYAFAHQADHVTAKYVRISTNAKATGATSAPLQLSADHLLFLHEHQEFPVVPTDLKKGDILLGAAGTEPLEIIKIEHNVMSQGIFAPLTADGTIAVNGIVASNYAFLLKSHPDDPSDYIYYKFGLWGNQKKQFKVMTQHGYMHMLCSPLRIAAFGISPWFGTPANDEGTNYFVGAFFQAHMWRLQQPHATTTTTGAAAVSAFGSFVSIVMSGIALICYAVECLVGPSMSPAVIGLVAMMAVTLVVNQRKQKKTQSNLNGSGLKIKAA